MIRAPGPSPCGSCPYRKDVPSGLWDAVEYERLPLYDGETWQQSPHLFMCHQQDGRICAGWAGCHDMYESMAFRIASSMMSDEEVEATLLYESPVPLWESGAAAAEHGLRDLLDPSPEARRAIAKLRRRRR